MNNAPFNMMEAVFIITVLFVAYLVLYRRLADMVQPVRLELAEIGERLLASSINERRKGQVSFCLDNAFNGLIMPIAAFIFPLCVFSTLIDIATKRRKMDVHVGDSEKKLTVLFIISAAAANPIFALLVTVELILCVPVLFLASGPAAVVSTLAATLKAERKLPFVKAVA